MPSRSTKRTQSKGVKPTVKAKSIPAMPKTAKPKSAKDTSKQKPVSARAPATSVGANFELIGKPAPAFELPDQSGHPVSLEALTASGNVVLYFYPKDMTPGCTVEACGFRDKIGAVRAAGARVVGVSADSAPSHQKFIDKHSLNFPLLSDPEHKVTAAYGVYKMKSLYGRAFMGIERTTFIIGRDGRVKKVFPKVKVDGHAEEVVAALKELG